MKSIISSTGWKATFEVFSVVVGGGYYGIVVAAKCCGGFARVGHEGFVEALSEVLY